MAKVTEDKVTTQVATKRKIVFIGKAWHNTVANEDSDYFGEDYFNGKFDRDIIVTVKEPVRDGNNRIVGYKTYEIDNINDSIQLWNNNKRTDADADLRISLSLADDESEEPSEEEEQEVAPKAKKAKVSKAFAKYR